MHSFSSRIVRRAVLPALVIFFGSLLAPSQVAVTTYHNDNNRTGWNNQETVLTPANVTNATFGLLHKVGLDDQVDAQPLVVPSVTITAGAHQGVHDVVYVATEGNHIFAIDAESGVVLLNPKFGAPVAEPLGCNNNGPFVGINSTPVIDLASKTMYVVVYNQDPTLGIVYRLHALDLGSLTNKVAPEVISASHTLTNGTTFKFNGKYQRQRPGLLLLNGNVYAAFGSFCDYSASQSRGWMLGWTASSLTPLPANQVLDTQPTDPDGFFLSSIWMSGYGPAADDSGNILFVTGNSDSGTYDGVSNIQESVVKISPDLTTVLDVFTPSDQQNLDDGDVDFGSGGVMVLPDQPGTLPHLAIAAGKEGNLFLMNEDGLGGYSTTTNNVIGTYDVGGCWCGHSYFVDKDGTARIVASGGYTVGLWQVNTSTTSNPSLTHLATSNVAVPNGQDPGFFTSVSSNGSAAPIVWVVSKPQNASPAQLFLMAFNPDSIKSAEMKGIFRAPAGNWPNWTGNANIVPTVANGEVFVASNKQLQIFGLKPTAKK
jgi:hypothetical protein